MNDRYKFRGMTLGGEWVYGNLAIINEKIKSCGMTIDAGYYISNKVGMPFAYPVRPETIGQCTGLKDKNGKLIYEGDIVLKSDVSAIGYSRTRVCKVHWHNDWLSWAIITQYGDTYELSEFEPQQYEVIGNIHENADLLENKE